MKPDKSLKPMGGLFEVSKTDIFKDPYLMLDSAILHQNILPVPCFQPLHINAQPMMQSYKTLKAHFEDISDASQED